MRIPPLASVLALLVPSLAPAQQELLKILPAPLPQTTGYGQRTALEGAIGLVRSNTLGPLVNTPGIAIVDLDSGAQLGALYPSSGNPNQLFGTSMDTHGGVVLVGAPDLTLLSEGTAYLFDIATGTELVQLGPQGGQGGETFGNAVSYDGVRALVGSPSATVASTNAGLVSVFDGSTGQFLFDLLPPAPAANLRFGASVSLAGNLALIGAPGELATPGTAYLFDLTTGQALFELSPAVVPVASFYGREVGLAPPYAVIGSRIDSGTLHVYDTGSGEELYALNPGTSTALGYFGQRLTAEGSRALVGDIGFGAFGAAYVIDLPTGAIEFELIASDADSADFFGSGLALQGNRALIGAPGEGLRGAAYYFNLDGLGSAGCTVSPNSTGEPGELFAAGSASLADESLELRMVGAPLGQPGLFFTGLAEAQIPFGDGTLCIGGTLLRLGSPVFEQGGEFVQDVDFSAAGAGLGAGTAYFQTWYRDPAAAGANFNLSDRVEVLLQP